MRIILSYVFEGWREEKCYLCGKETEPYYDFSYYTDLTDDFGNPIGDIDIRVCKKCCSKVDKNWKKKLK